MNRFDARVLLGLLLVLGGLLLLLQNLNLISIAWDFVWAAIFVALGLAFLGVFLENTGRWWAVIPAFTLLSLGIVVVLQNSTPAVARVWGGSVFLGGIGLSFWLVYLVSPRNWWAIIPGGVLVTLAAVAGLGTTNGGSVAGGVFFLGLGLTFVLVYLLPSPDERKGWALIPAGVLLLMGILVLAAATSVLDFLWPLLLILSGIYLVVRALLSQRG